MDEIDNIFIERFWRTLKYEEVYTKCYETVAECRASIGEFIRKYNEERLHQSLGNMIRRLRLIINYQRVRHVKGNTPFKKAIFGLDY